MDQNVKGILIAHLMSEGLGTPTFECQQHGLPHAPLFRATVLLDGRIIGQGEGRSKKEAERVAAAQALETDWQAPIPEAELADSGQAPVDQAHPAPVWPIYSEVLAESVEVALELATEQDGPDEVRRVAVRFYQELLRDLGHVPVEQ